ncbi:hypothetical protein D3C85_1153710 [compost metagenome]
MPAVQLEKVRSTTAEYMEKLGQQLADAKAETAAAIARAEKAEANLKSLDERTTIRIKALEQLLDAANKARTKAESNVTENIDLSGEWLVQHRRKNDRKWKNADSKDANFNAAKESVDYMQYRSGSGQDATWRAVRTDGLIYWPKAPK